MRHIFIIKNNDLVSQGQMPYNDNYLNNLYSGVIWIATSDLPADFSTDTYTIENGKLVKASEEVIAERLRIKQVAQREAIRVAREARYNSEQISSLYWNWVESGNAADKAKWIEAKEQVRKELPYPNEKGGGE